MPRTRPANAETTFGAPDRDPIGAFVRARRRAGGLTQRQLAELVGVGARVISEIERGKPTLRMDVVNKVLAAFGKRLGLGDMARDRAEER